MMKSITQREIDIPNLYKIKKGDREKLFAMYLRAFEEYPKLVGSFPKRETRLIALEATIRFYCTYDLHNGSSFSLDENIREAVVIVHSDKMNYNLFRHILAGSYGKEYRRAMKRLSKKERQVYVRLYQELDLLEEDIPIPMPHLYIDFLGTDPEYQGQGRGKKLMRQICEYADSVRLPIMLFTNTEADVKFYQGLGFHIIGVTSSETFGFVNTYLLYEPK